jgi:hypothetical protein
MKSRLLMLIVMSMCLNGCSQWSKLPEADHTQPAPPGTEAANVCVTRDPQPEFCAPVPAPTLRPGIQGALDKQGVPPGLDKGSLRLNPGTGCWEILEFSRTGVGVEWRNYDPAIDWGTANKAYQIRRGWSGGHTGDDAMTAQAVWYNEVHPEAPLPGECLTKAEPLCCRWIEMEYSAPLRAAAKAAWCQAQPEPKPEACGGSSPTQPTCPAGTACRPEPPKCPECPSCPLCPALAPVPAELLKISPDWIVVPKGRNAKRDAARKKALQDLVAWLSHVQACEVRP